MRTAFAATLAITAALGLPACGGSSKPGYCSDRSNLQQSLKDLGNAKVLQSGGVQQLKSQLQKIGTEAQKLASSAKSDFPTESSAVESSVTGLKTSVEQLPASPSAAEIAGLAGQAKAVVTAFDAFKKATDSKCS